MFGFMKPVHRSNEYRKLYCDSCRFLREYSGQSSTVFLSYEAVLVHALAVDAGYMTLDEAASPCRILPIPKRIKSASETHLRIGEFSAALTMLLVKTKLEDDIMDDKSFLAELTSRFYRNAFEKAIRYFEVTI